MTRVVKFLLIFTLISLTFTLRIRVEIDSQKVNDGGNVDVPADTDDSSKPTELIDDSKVNSADIKIDSDDKSDQEPSKDEDSDDIKNGLISKDDISSDIQNGPKNASNKDKDSIKIGKDLSDDLKSKSVKGANEQNDDVSRDPKGTEKDDDDVNTSDPTDDDNGTAASKCVADFINDENHITKKEAEKNKRRGPKNCQGKQGKANIKSEKISSEGLLVSNQNGNTFGIKMGVKKRHIS